MATALLIGDDLMVVDSTEAPPEKAGHEGTIAGNGEKAIGAFFRFHHIDISRGAEKVGVTDALRKPIANDYQLSPGGRRRVASD